MNPKIRELLKSFKKINLEPLEKNRLRDHLLFYAKSHPIKSRNVSQPSFNIFDYLFLRPLPRLAAVILLAFMGFGSLATVAAEKSLPGEFLHPVKIKINENVRSLFARSSYAKAEWEVEKASRRLVEVEKLAGAGKLKAEEVKEAGERLESNLQKASEEIGQVKIKEGEDRASEMKSTVGALLLVHQDVLKEIGQSLEKKEMKEETKTEFGSLRKNVKERIREVNEDLVKETQGKKSSLAEDSAEKEEAPEVPVSLRISSEGPEEEKKNEQRILPQAAAEGKLKAAENKIEEAGKFIALKKNKVSSEVVLEAERILQEARDSADEGKAKINSGDNNDSFSLFQKAILLAQTSHRLMRVAQEVPPASSLRFEEKIKTEGKETEFKTRIEISNGREDEEENEEEIRSENKGSGEDKEDDGDGEREGSNRGPEDDDKEDQKD